jgi:hypothetical protein
LAADAAVLDGYRAEGVETLKPAVIWRNSLWDCIMNGLCLARKTKPKQPNGI